jgi:hypothetical protein
MLYGAVRFAKPLGNFIDGVQLFALQLFLPNFLQASLYGLFYEGL